ncbi:thioredoxin domain-containing protein [Lederbergia lenta]|uniref:Protein-disulfide isomerase n=1 Tax=Lederbergia lenta TaxID=1467 RepID=A0A2X4WJL7_LEDLE|nr:thioredoxin domain-containing protein [Lederbergia lenta]MEC2324643.1 thioredoxin domain-containing protein [Lederbergia lenta]SQI58912.1 Protein-disulfide isomerase [Lederbergia lenta]
MTDQIKNRQFSFGKKDAAVKVEVFLNLTCPYCATFYGVAEVVLKDYLENGQVEFIVKHYDKPREMLLNGTLVNLFLDYENPSRVKEILRDLFETQGQWDQLNNQEIKNLLVQKYQLKEEPKNTEISLNVTTEAISRNVKMVPTVFINNKEFQYPTELSATELKTQIEEALAK